MSAPYAFVCSWQILLKKSFGGSERNFPEPLMRFVRNDVKNDHGLSYWRYAASQRRTCPKINICEIFGVFQFSTFSTVSVKRRSNGPASPCPLRSQQTCGDCLGVSVLCQSWKSLAASEPASASGHIADASIDRPERDGDPVQS